jgi:hypothetical protein
MHPQTLGTNRAQGGKSTWHGKQINIAEAYPKRK